MMFSKKKYNLALVLSGGSARGFTHLGVLKALEEHGLKPDVISGVSAGAIVGAFYADGKSPDEILELFSNSRLLNLIKVSFPRRGLFKISGLRDLINDHLKSKTFEDLNIDLLVGVTNYNQGHIEYLGEGDLLDRVIASSSIPIFFEPQKLGNELYMDGGILDNLPIDPVKKISRRIIASHVNPTGPVDEYKNILSGAERSFHLSAGKGVQEQRKDCDVFIEPIELTNYHILDLENAPKMFEIGYQDTLKALKKKKII